VAAGGRTTGTRCGRSASLGGQVEPHHRAGRSRGREPAVVGGRQHQAGGGHELDASFQPDILGDDPGRDLGAAAGDADVIPDPDPRRPGLGGQ
jgi:hypothetical protein